MTAIEFRHVESPEADRFNTIYADRRVGYREVGIHHMLVTAAESGDEGLARKIEQSEMDDQDFCEALDTLEYYGYLVRGSKVSGPVGGKWVVFDVASIPGIVNQREALVAQGYEVVEPFGLPLRAAEGA